MKNIKEHAVREGHTIVVWEDALRPGHWHGSCSCGEAVDADNDDLVWAFFREQGCR